MRFLIEEPNQCDGNEAEWQIYVENPFPTDMVGDIGAEKRTENTGNAEYGAEQPAQPPPFLRGKRIEHDRERNRNHGPTADSLNRTENAQLNDRTRYSA